MYSIRWNSSSVVVGRLDDILALANIFENLGCYFKISDVAGLMLSQGQLGCSGYKLWLNPKSSFPC